MKRVPDCHPDREHKCRGMCSACYQRYKASSAFVTAPRVRQVPTCGHPDRKAVGHGKCQRCYTRFLREKQGEAGRTERRVSRIRSVYGLTESAYGEMLNAQANRCALCCREFTKQRFIQVDHCHDSGRVRGLLCFSCNKGLGMLGDNEVALQRALAYVRGAPMLMRKLDQKASDRCGLTPEQEAARECRRTSWRTAA